MVSQPLIGVTTERTLSKSKQPTEQFVLTSAYVQALRQAGALPVLIPLGLDDDALRGLFARLDGVLLTGGEDLAAHLYGAEHNDHVRGVDEDRDRLEICLVRWSAEQARPILGICRGCQVFNVALGGTLYRDIAAEAPGAGKHDFYHGEPRDYLAHPVAVAEGSLLARVLGAPIVQVNSRHHQAAKDPAPGVEVAARSPDGVIEALEVPGHPFALSVQWHPEWLQHLPETRRLFEGFVRAAAGETSRR